MFASTRETPCDSTRRRWLRVAKGNDSRIVIGGVNFNVAADLAGVERPGCNDSSLSYAHIPQVFAMTG